MADSKSKDRRIFKTNTITRSDGFVVTNKEKVYSVRVLEKDSFNREGVRYDGDAKIFKYLNYITCHPTMYPDYCLSKLVYLPSWVHKINKPETLSTLKTALEKAMYDLGYNGEVLVRAIGLEDIAIDITIDGARYNFKLTEVAEKNELFNNGKDFQK